MPYKPIRMSFGYKPVGGYKRRRSTRRYTRGRKPLAPRRTGGFFGVRQRTIGAEKKTIDQSWNSTASSDNLDPWLLNATQTGSDFTDRIGRRIKMKSLLLNVYATINATTTANIPAMVRVLCVLDKQWNATATTGGAIGGTPPVGTGIGLTTILKVVSINSPLNLNNRDRYKVLCDKYLPLSIGGPQSRNLKVYKKNLNIETTYGGTTFSGGSIQTNAVIIWIISERISTSADEPSITVNSRIRFIDM